MRLTRKNVEVVIDNGTGYAYIYNKLRQLENIEDELGIDLITLFKALKNGIYVKLDNLDITFIEQVSMDNVIEEPCFYYCNENTINLGGLIHPSYTELYFKDYGKTWALTEKELL